MRSWFLIAALALSACAPDKDGDGFSGLADCDDEDPSVHDGAEELCDGVDNDCDGRIDDDATDAVTWFLDFDGDGHGDGRFSQVACEAPEGHVEAADDCDDNDDRYHPGATEDDCTDPEDYNCDGSVGYADADGDGFPACEDCDDSSGRTNPDALETCNGVDDDCNGIVDDDAVDALVFHRDADGDGFGSAEDIVEACDLPGGYVIDATDCDDTTDTTFPGADERCNGADDDCDAAVDEDDAVDAPTWYTDLDGDGHGGARVTVRACAQPDGTFAEATDCDDLDGGAFPGADERCNGADDDCDGTTDEDDAVDAPTWYADADGDGWGDPVTTAAACEAPSGYLARAGDCDDTVDSTFPGADETCNEVDDDCDGTTDEDDAIDALTVYVDSDGDGFGDPRYTARTCTSKTGYVDNDEDCNDLTAEVNPDADEVCDGLDNDCDGDTDPDALVLGDAEDCPAASCLAILDVRSGAPDGDYVLEDGSGVTYEVECDMTTDGGGWTTITGAHLDDLDLMEFDIVTGSASSVAGGDWTSERGVFELVPENAGTGSCAGVAVRATATLPFTFTEWSGQWTGTEARSGGHADDDSTDTSWGEVTDDTSCSGHMLFGTDLDDSKVGGLWGYSWTAYGGETWTWSATSVSETDVVRWEVMDNYAEEGVRFSGVELKVR